MDGSWNLSIDGAPAISYTGKTAAIVGLLAGNHAIRVNGLLSGKSVRAEAVANVKAGFTASVVVTLE